MKTKQVTMYECEVCGKEYPESGMALNCEQDHREWQQYLEGQTTWGQEFIEEAGVDLYVIALRLLEESDNQVDVFETDELGYYVWAIVPIEDTSFWLNNFSTKKEAENFCKEMGWKYEDI